MINAVNHVAQSWWGWMGPMIWQVSLLILIISAIDLFLRRWAWPQVRYAIWLLILIKLLIPPSWTLPSSLISRWQPLAQARLEQILDVSFQSPTTKDAVKLPALPSETKIVRPNLRSSKEPTATSPAGASPLTAGPRLGWKAVAMMGWILGIAVFTGLLAHRITRLRRWHRHQVEKKTIPVWYYEILVRTADRLKLGRLPAIVFSDEAKAPAVYGVFRPVLLLPAVYLDSLAEEDAEHVLLHELAHLKRGDLWLHGMFLLIQIVYWFNPLIIWARRQMKHVREVCCDLTVASLLKEKTVKYRQTLLSTARELLTESAEPGMGLLGVFEDPFRLVVRLKWLEKKTWENRKLITATAVLVTLVLTAGILPMGRASEKRIPPVAIDQSEFRTMEEAQLKGLRLDVEIKMRPPLYAAVLPMVGELNEFGNVVSRAKKLLDDAGITPTDSPFGYYLSDSEEVRPEEFIWAAGYPIPPGTKVARPLEILQVSEQQIACATIEGIRLTDKVWARFAQAIKDRGHVPAFPPAVEFWRGGGEGEKISWKTEMQIQVFHPDRGYPGMEIAFKETKPFTAVVLPLRGYFADLSEAAGKLEKYLKDKKVRTAGPPFGRYLTDPSKVPFSQNEWEVGYPVEEGTEAEPPFEIRRFDGEKVAFTILPGPPEPDYPWAPFILQLMMKGYLPVGPATEIWHGRPEKSGAPQIELQIPIAEPKDIAESAVKFGREIAEAVENRDKEVGKSVSEPPAGEGEEPGTGTAVSHAFSFQVKQAEPFQAVMLTATGPSEELAVAMKKLQAWMEQSGTRPAGPSFIQQNSNLRVENPEYPTSWDVGYPVPEGTLAPAPFKIREYPATLETSVRLAGTFDGDELNQQWSSWLLDGNYMAAGGAMVFCPDRLYGRGDGRHRWEVRTAIKKIEKKLPDLEISTQWAKPTIAVVLPMRGRHSQEPEALAKLEAYMKEIRLSPVGKPFFRYFNDDQIFPEEDLLWEVGYPVPEGSSVRSPFEIKRLEGGLEAYSEFECASDEAIVYYWSAALRAMRRGFFAIGYPTVIQTAKPDKGRIFVEVRMLVRKKRPNYQNLPEFY